MTIFEIRSLSSSPVLLFSEADEKAVPLQKLQAGTKVHVLECSEAFAQVALPFEAGGQGWVRKEAISIFSATPEKQHIVRLVAGCSSGKSSVEEALIKKNCNWVVIDDDTLCYEYMIKALRERFREAFAVISEGIEERNLYQAFLRDKVCFKATTPTTPTTPKEKREEIAGLLINIRKELDKPCNIEWRHSVLKAVEVKIIEVLRKAVFEGKHVLLTASSVSLEQLKKEQFFSKIVKVFLYNPMGRAFDQLIERNECAMREGNYEPMRFPTFVPESHCRLMKLTQDKATACDVGSRQKMEVIFDRAIEKIERVRPEGTSHTFSQYDFSKEQVRAWQKEFFSPLSEGQDLCYITPKDKYDVILRGDKATPEGLSQSLLEAISLRE